MSDYGTIEDGFGSCWARCKPDCQLEVVRPGKCQCNDCDSKCGTCRGELGYYLESDSPFQGLSGTICVACTDAMGWPRKADQAPSEGHEDDRPESPGESEGKPQS